MPLLGRRGNSKGEEVSELQLPARDNKNHTNNVSDLVVCICKRRAIRPLSSPHRRMQSDWRASLHTYLSTQCLIQRIFGRLHVWVYVWTFFFFSFVRFHGRSLTDRMPPQSTVYLRSQQKLLLRSRHSGWWRKRKFKAKNKHVHAF